ncbi:MAG: hypothetical protein FWC67_03315, partial [Defluviitaleaceae bacterium]|nr:hypothetical protein [Defluviitaleaceae bacterium]
QGGQHLLMDGLRHPLGLRYSAPEWPFVEPVFTNSQQILHYDDDAAPPLFNWNRLGMNYVAGNGAERGSLLSLITSRGLGPVNYQSDVNSTDPRERFDMNVAVLPRVVAQFDTLVNSIVMMFNNAFTTPSNITNPAREPQNQHGHYHGSGTPPRDLSLFVRIHTGPSDPWSLGNIIINPLFSGEGGSSHLPLTFDGESDMRLTLDLMRHWNSDFITFGNWEPTGINLFYRRFITEMGTGGREAIGATVRNAEAVEFVQARRLSVKAVSLEEEMSNMIRFQHAYNASSRVINTIDSMIDRIVNGLGAGRG